MATKQTCYVCNPTVWTASLCSNCIDKVAGYDALKDRLRSAMRLIRKSRDAAYAEAQECPMTSEAIVGRAIGDTLSILLNTLFFPELTEEAAKSNELQDIENARGPVTALCAEGTNEA